MTDAEQLAVLRATGAFERDFRDHMLLSLAVGTGLREHELAALDVGDVLDVRGEVVRRIAIGVFKGCRRAGRRARGQVVIVPDECRRKLARFARGRASTEPLFASREGGRLSLRQIRTLWQRWQIRAGLERHHPFHALRHTFVSNLYRATRDPVLAQRLARHARIETTLAYTHLSDEATERAARPLPC